MLDSENRATAQATLRDIERLAARLFYLQTVALMANDGSWPDELSAEWLGGSTTKFTYDVKNVECRFPPTSWR